MRAEIADQILKLCSKQAQRPQDLADQLGLSVHTVRSYYCYQLVKDGKLVRALADGPRPGQAYKTV